MRLNFAKMNGAGNDVMIVEWPQDAAPIDADLVRKWGDRRRGVGFDQLMLIEPGAGDSPAYRIFNSDGGEVEQCGNGVRCLAQFLAPRYGANFTLVSPAGSIDARVLSPDSVSVNLGEPNFDPQSLPFTVRERRDRHTLEVLGRTVEFGAVSMGNPHIVIEVDSVQSAPVGILGPVLEKHPSFPRGVNVGFMQRQSTAAIALRVFERGAGETLACGTGAAAAVAVGRTRGELDENVQVHLPGGTLHVSWRGPGHALWQTGPTTLVYEGQIDI